MTRSLPDIIRAIDRASNVQFALNAVGRTALRRAERAGAIVYDGQTICLTEIGYLLRESTCRQDTANALVLRRLLNKEEQP